MYELHTVPVSRYFVGEGERIHVADNPLSFEQADSLLNRLRDERPGVQFTLCAEIDA